VEETDCNNILNVGNNLKFPTAYILLFEKVDDVSGSEATYAPASVHTISDESTYEDINNYVAYYLNENNITDENIQERLKYFIIYQLGGGGRPSFQTALEEIMSNCTKNDHWIWYVLPSKLPDYKQSTAQKYTEMSIYFCINNPNFSQVMVSHYLMIPYLKQNYETIIRAIHHCLIENNTPIQTLFSIKADIPKFFSSITEFLDGYSEYNSESEFIDILQELKELEHNHQPLSGGAIKHSNAKPKTKKIFKSANPNSKLTKGKLVFTK
jgi:uncharacterized protein (DUF1810 family)